MVHTVDRYKEAETEHNVSPPDSEGLYHVREPVCCARSVTCSGDRRLVTACVLFILCVVVLSIFYGSNVLLD